MRVQHQQIKWVSEGGTRRPEDISRATPEESGTARSTLAGDDGSASKPLVGSSVLKGPMMERNSTSLRKPINVATWNMRGMSDGKVEIVEKEMAINDIKVLGISESWWLGQGRFTSDDGNRIIFSGKRGGVGFIIVKATAKCVLGYNPINERIMTVRLQGSPMNISIIQVYAPTVDAPEEEITDFYEMVQDVVDSIPRKDFLIILVTGMPRLVKRGKNLSTFAIIDWHHK